WQGISWASIPALAVVAILAVRRLGQVRPVLVSIARMVVQLWLLGVVLGWVFATSNSLVVLAGAVVVLLVSGHTVGSRPKGPVWAIRLEALASTAVSLAIVMFVCIRLALRLEPWYDPRTFIPLMGIVLGNSVNGVSLAAERLESELRADRDRVE